jgi:hypothetical protein
MRKLAIVLAVAAITAAAAHGALAERKIRLAQSSTVTTCMMACNAQAANCQSTCLVPTPIPLGTSQTTSTPNPNNTASTTCLLTCTSTQITDYADAWDCRVLHTCAA